LNYPDLAPKYSLSFFLTGKKHNVGAEMDLGGHNARSEHQMTFLNNIAKIIQ